ncbi:MAG TPA: peptidase [Bacteroidia bacterium]|jgi:hypothetical protein|nr:peptidase [Bacteroidia bacterium]
MKASHLFRSAISLSIVALFVFAGCKKTNPASPGNNGVTSGDFLSSRNYDKMTVEIQYIAGYQPSSATIGNLTSFLQSRLNKPAGINVTQKAISISGKSAYSLIDIQAIEHANRTQNTSGSTITAYVFFADGDYAGNAGSSQVLGITYGFSSIVIFEKTIQNLSGGVGQPSVSTLESTVSEHEFGHALGLVNNGTSMQASHQDTPHGKHCTSTSCLMYYSVETSDVVANLLGGIPTLDANCLNDLHANGGR